MVVVTRSSHKHAACSMMEKLPPDVMVHVLEYSKLHDRVRLASCSTLLRRIVYKNCPVVWVDIDLSHSLALTDRALASLLTQVNARLYTKHLTLHCCTSVGGSGLEPLRNSRVLERVDLRAASIDERIVIRILRTTMVHRLFDARFHAPHTHQQRTTCARTNFLRDLRAAKRQQLQDEQIVCTFCTDAVVDRAPQHLVVNATGVPSHKCAKCQLFYCRRPSCSVGLKDCSGCADAYCQHCNSTQQCDFCAKSYCEPCGGVNSCNDCKDKFCAHCGDVDECDLCQKSLCGSCNEEQNLPIGYCFECDKAFCRDCRNVSFCCLCEQTMCESCAVVKYCENCLERFCTVCREVNFLSCCDAMLCAGCIVPRKCHGCHLNFCKERVETCARCDKTFCVLCKALDNCGGCLKSFCNDDCVSVDLCEQCGTCYCDACALVLRCTRCGKASCDNCRLLTGGFCLMCCIGERPPKRAKLSHD